MAGQSLPGLFPPTLRYVCASNPPAPRCTKKRAPPLRHPTVVDNNAIARLQLHFDHIPGVLQACFEFYECLVQGVGRDGLKLVMPEGFERVSLAQLGLEGGRPVDIVGLNCYAVSWC